jgi:pyruvate carboxylase
VSKTDIRNVGKIAVQALKHHIEEINSILKESPSKALIILRGGEGGGGRGMGVMQSEKEGGGGWEGARRGRSTGRGRQGHEAGGDGSHSEGGGGGRESRWKLMCTAQMTN